MKLSGVNYLFGQGIKNIWTNRIMSVASFCILMVSLLLVGFSVLFIVNVNSIIGGIENKNEVIIYLDDISEDEITAMGNKLRSLDNISDVVFFSKDEAFAQMKSEMADSEELFQYVGEESPLPDSYRVKVADIEKNEQYAYVDKPHQWYLFRQSAERFRECSYRIEAFYLDNLHNSAYGARYREPRYDIQCFKSKR